MTPMQAILLDRFPTQGNQKQQWHADPHNWFLGPSYVPAEDLYGDSLGRIWEALHKYREHVQAWRDSVDEVRAYSLPVAKSFQIAMSDYPTVSVKPNVMGGAPCVDGTRIPVYMILDAIEHHGSPDGVLESYPSLTAEQVKDAIGFARIAVECPLGDDAP